MTPTRPAGFVLVHGGQHGSWCWRRLVPLLDRPALAVDLPGREGNPALFRTITLDDWITAIVDQVEDFAARPVAMVAHSLGGVSMPAAAAKLGPDTVTALVFISAVIPEEGQTACDAFRVEARNLFADDGGFHVPHPEAARHSLCNDMSEADAAYVLGRLRPEAGLPMQQPVTRAEMPDVPRIYVRPTLDNGVPPDMQETMIANLGGATEEVVEAGHDVIFSRPRLIADILNRL